MSREKGFVIGASEDGIVYYRKDKNEYGLEIDQKSRKWLETVQRNLKKSFNKESKIRKTSKGYFRLNVYSKDLYNELLNFRRNPKIILRQNRSFQIGFLQGIFDAEGSIRLERNHITLSSKRPETIKVVKKLLKDFEFQIGKLWKDKNNVVTIPFYGKDNMKKFSKLINFRHPEKLKRLELLLS